MIRIELLTARHDRRTFDCGEPSLDDRAAAFYRHYGFEPFRDDPRRLFLRVDWP